MKPNENNGEKKMNENNINWEKKLKEAFGIEPKKNKSLSSYYLGYRNPLKDDEWQFKWNFESTDEFEESYTEMNNTLKEGECR